MALVTLLVTAAAVFQPFTIGAGAAFPSVTGFTPANCETEVPVDSTIAITFDENISPGIFFDDLVIKTYKSGMPFTYTIAGDTLTLTPNFTLSYSMTYSVTIPAGAVKDAAGNPNKYIYGFSFTTEAPAAASPPVVNEAESYPRQYARDMAVDKPITIKFNEVILAGPAFNYITLKDANNRSVAITNKKIQNGLLTIYTYQKKKDTRYTLTIPASAVKDKDGNMFAGAYRLSFTTKAR
ncbi:MAG: hypothetical protein HPY50_22525 [Firmicutes bacterium]|nr:hypothetical protein [Bacillota bacterium]